MKAIAAIDKNRALGYRGQLLFHLPTDLAHFKENTLGRTLIMGRKTLESMPKGRPLPGRQTLVLSSSMPGGQIYEDSKGYKSYSFRSIEELRAFPGYKDAVVCGGAAIYALLLDECDELIITEVQEEAEEADVWFPEYKELFGLEEEQGPFEDGEYTYFIRRYKRKQKL